MCELRFSARPDKVTSELALTLRLPTMTVVLTLT
jgi:hypothetical protein